MTRARSELVCLEETPYYHIICRCVRRAFLCGQDYYSWQSYEHRRGWIVDRIRLLTSVFAIDVCAYAVMNNHYHLVLRVKPAAVENWSNHEVVERWHQLFSLPLLVQRWRSRQDLSKAEVRVVDKIIQTWRSRLLDLSWFMRCLNEAIARAANKEDRCTGRFWEGRFKTQALLDETALLTCMAYVDLNPIRAGIATTPETSAFTSIQERIKSINTQGLAPFANNSMKTKRSTLPYAFTDYLELVDWTGRIIRHDNHQNISPTLPPILDRLGIDPNIWLQTINHYPHRFHTAVGSLHKLQQRCERLKQRWLCGLGGIIPLYHPEPM